MCEREREGGTVLEIERERGRECVREREREGLFWRLRGREVENV